MRRLRAGDERWPTRAPFVIARGAKSEAHVLVVEIDESGVAGRGEATPYPRYDDSMEAALDQVQQARHAVEGGASRTDLLSLLPPGAARNAIDCALWDLEAKSSGARAWRLAGRARLDPVKTCYTISLGPAEEMAAVAAAERGRAMLKLKIGGADDVARVEAVRAAAPKTRLIVDANEALDISALEVVAREFAKLGVLLIEQPLPASEDEALEGFQSPVPLCADESVHTRADLAACARRYACVNVKLDKAGGLTEALALTQEARALGLEIMAGCMVGTSLAMAPALLIAQGARFVDLDGPLLLARDRSPGLEYLGSMIAPPPAELWG